MKTIAFLLLLWITAGVSAQTSDERVAYLMNQSDWTGLGREFKVSKDSLSPLLHDFAKALLTHTFNRPDEAIGAIGELLKQHQAEMGSDNVINMVGCLAKNLAKLGRYEEAADMMENLYQQLKTGGAEEAGIARYQRLIKEYRALAGCGELLQCSKPNKNITIPFLTNNEGKGQYAIRFQCLLNGKENEFVLDTGAGVNVVSPEIAKACKMKILDAPIVTGIQSTQGELAIAEELRFGEITLRNVPFYVLDLKTGHPEADKAMQQLGIIIGIPVINKLQEIQLDFAHNRMIVPQTPTPNPFKMSNLSMDSYDILLLEVLCKQERLKLLFDTGAAYSALGQDYFNRHKDHIQAIGQKDSIRIAGFGGFNDYQPIYKIPNFCVQIGNAKGCIPSVSIETTDVKRAVAAGKDGLFGIQLFRAFSKMTINLKEMYVEATPRTDIQESSSFDSSKMDITLPPARKLTPTDVILGATQMLLEWKVPQKNPGLLDK